MREDLSSTTASLVAFIRAVASVDPELSRACQDPYAEALLPRPLARLVRAARRGPAGARLLGTLRTLSFGMFDHLALRTALIDAALAHALEEGIDQVVLLGAGFDARAHRLQAVAKAVVFEVDHAATQRAKRAKAQALPVLARALRYVPCDFERDALADVLVAAGFEPSQRTVWVWEGVTPYLPAAAVASSLRAIASLSADASLLIVTYVTPELIAAGERLGQLLVSLLGPMISEPLRFTASPEQFAAQLLDAGFELLSDAAPTDAAPHFDVEVKRPSSLMPAERIAVAIKR